MRGDRLVFVAKPSARLRGGRGGCWIWLRIRAAADTGAAGGFTFKVLRDLAKRLRKKQIEKYSGHEVCSLFSEASLTLEVNANLLVNQNTSEKHA